MCFDASKYILDGHNVDFVTSICDLGVQVDSELKFASHCSYIYIYIYKGLVMCMFDIKMFL
jgi:hypothetical protein